MTSTAIPPTPKPAGKTAVETAREEELARQKEALERALATRDERGRWPRQAFIEDFAYPDEFGQKWFLCDLPHWSFSRDHLYPVRAHPQMLRMKAPRDIYHAAELYYRSLDLGLGIGEWVFTHEEWNHFRKNSDPQSFGIRWDNLGRGVESCLIFDKRVIVGGQRV